MPLLRAWLRAALLILWTAAIFAAWAAGWPFGWLSEPRRVTWRSRMLRTWARGTARLLGVDLVARGAPPEGGELVVANHLSYVDVVVLASQLRCAFVAKAEVRGWPVIGWMVAAMNTVFVDRDRGRSIPLALERVDRLLAAGCSVVIFPEGTSSRGAEVCHFHPSLLARAAAVGRPVHYAALGYGTARGEPPAHLSVCWWGDMTLPPHLWHLLGMSGFRASVVFGDEPIRSLDRKRLADSLQAAVAGRFTPVVNMEEACA
jgi:1-acyl-sn-glycerol-3-phosphate acyltransferase